MHTVTTVLVAVVAICAIGNSPGATTAPTMSQPGNSGEENTPDPSSVHYFRDVIMPKFVIPLYKYDAKSNYMKQSVFTDVKPDLLTKEIMHLNQMETEETDDPMYDDPITKNFMSRMLSFGRPPLKQPFQNKAQDQNEMIMELENLPRSQEMDMAGPISPPYSAHPDADSTEINDDANFALTPFSREYYEKEHLEPVNDTTPANTDDTESEDSAKMEPRQTRQNPNYGTRAKALVAEDIDKLKIGLANKEYRLPVSLLPTNLRWLKISHDDDNEESSGDGSTNKPHHIHVMEAAASDPAESIFGVALMAAIGTALTMAILGFGFGWYTLSKKAKAAADVDYPAYGVTGPTVDSSGDRKLAHSAHMYHYQHQKQQIIAMERNGLDQRHGSISDPESDEENEEGDYTVYECRGFATTGDMEVKNPLFAEDATPATPGKCEVVKQQPKK